MPNNSEYVYNADSLVVSALLLIGVLIFHAFYLFIVSHNFHRAIDCLAKRNHKFLLEIPFLVAAFVLSASHVIEILLLGYSVYWLGLISNIHQALVFVGSTYTTVGFGSDLLSESWQLVMVTIALSGLLTIAWTTSVLFGMATTTRTAQVRISQVQ